MPSFRCKDYGFECDFIAEGDDNAKVIMEYSKHSAEEHGIEYSKEALMQFILRKGWKVKFIAKKFGEHSEKEHGIEYAKEALMQFIVRQQGWNVI